MFSYRTNTTNDNNKKFIVANIKKKIDLKIKSIRENTKNTMVTMQLI